MFAKFFDRCVHVIACRVAALLPFDDVCKHIAGHLNITRVSEVVCDLLDLSEIEQEIAKKVTISATDVAGEIDTNDLINGLDQDELADKMAGYIELDYDKVVAAIDIDYSEIASSLDLSDVAREIDTSNMDFDYSEIVSNLCMSTLADEFSVSDIASQIDYEQLAKALLSQFAKAKAVECRPSAT